MEKKQVVTGLGWSFAQKLLSQIVTLIVSTVLARILAPEYYGTISLVTVFIMILDAFVTGGFSKALIQKKDADQKDFDTIAIFSIALSLLLYTIIFLCAPLIATFY